MGAGRERAAIAYMVRQAVRETLPEVLVQGYPKEIPLNGKAGRKAESTLF